MRDLMHFIREFTVWLHQPLFEYGLFYLDLWSLVHFWSGMMVFTGLSALNWQNRWRWLVFFLTAFELLEASIFIAIMKMFRPEKLPDCFTDVIVGMAGGFLVFSLFEKRKITIPFARLFIGWLAAGTISFLWTGNYGYLTSNATLETLNFNWGSFLNWMIAGMGVLYLFEKISDAKIGWIKSAAITWGVYSTALLFLIGITANLLNADELAHANPSLLKFVGANDVKTLFYFTAPFLFIGFYRLLNLLFRRYFVKYNLYETK